MYIYKITLIGMQMNTSTCPPSIVSSVFPLFNGEPTTLTPNETTVTFATEQTPVDLGTLVRVELLQNN
jgi:hypothetical protein